MSKKEQDKRRAWASSIENGEKVTEAFMVAFKAIKLSRNGNPYMDLILQDKSGTIEAKVWDRADEIGKRFKRGDIIRVKGKGNFYQTKMQLIVEDLVRVPEEEVPMEDFLPESVRPVEEMWRELEEVVRGVTSPEILAFLRALLGDEEIREGLRRAPAAKVLHHACLGGLLEHTLSVVSLALAVAHHYRRIMPHIVIDQDLLVAGAVLHDIGKIRELDHRSIFDYSDEGRLLGHLVLGLEIVDKVAQGVDIAPMTVLKLKHMIVSHHGELELGSAKRPKFIEALILHHLDNMDAKVVMMEEATRAVDETGWTAFNKSFGRFLMGPDEIPEPPEVEAELVVEPEPVEVEPVVPEAALPEPELREPETVMEELSEPGPAARLSAMTVCHEPEPKPQEATPPAKPAAPRAKAAPAEVGEGELEYDLFGYPIRRK